MDRAVAVDGRAADPGVPGGRSVIDAIEPSPRPSVRRLRIGAIAITGAAVAAGIVAPVAVPAVDTRMLAVVGASLATALALALAGLNGVLYRLAGDPRSLYIAVAAVCLGSICLGFGILLPAVADSPALDSMRDWFALAAIPGLAGIALASRSLEAASRHSPRPIVVTIVGATIGIAALGGVAPWLRTPGDRPGVPLPLAGPTTSLLITAGLLAIVAVHVVAARRQSGQPLSWSALAAGGIAVAYGITAVEGDPAEPFAWLVVAAAVAVGLYGAAAELDRHHEAEQRRAFAAVAKAFGATARAQAVTDAQAESRHEAGSALLGIEAAATSLAEHRALLGPAEFDALSHGLVAEIHRLRSLVEQRTTDPAIFELSEVVGPVASCLRANGLDVCARVPPGIVVAGVPEQTAQVLSGLLTNAGRHAPGSPVELRAEAGDDHVTVYVEDRGPGVPEPLREHVFERGVAAGDGSGSGLGLFISRRLLDEQHASITVKDRPGGGSSFVLQFPSGAAA